MIGDNFRRFVAEQTETAEAEREFAARRIEEAAERGAARQVAADQPETLLTVKETATRLNVTDRTVRNLIARGQLATVQIPSTKARRIEPAAVDGLIRAGREVCA